MNKERKFGPGCVDSWLRDRDLLIQRAANLLAPSFSTLGKQRFLFGETPTLADAALHGQSLMLDAASPALVGARISVTWGPRTAHGRYLHLDSPQRF